MSEDDLLRAAPVEFGTWRLLGSCKMREEGWLTSELPLIVEVALDLLFSLFALISSNEL